MYQHIFVFTVLWIGPFCSNKNVSSSPWRHENKLSDCFGKSMTYSMFTFPRTPDADIFCYNLTKMFLRSYFKYIFQQFHEIFFKHRIEAIK